MEDLLLKERLAAVEETIQNACQKAGRSREDVLLLAVSKTHPPERIREAYTYGLRAFGENKVQELSAKIPLLPTDIAWHMIGHLQRNKVKQILGKAVLIHSLDSLRLAETLEKEAAKKEMEAAVLVEVNVAKEESKYGLFPEDTLSFIREVSAFPHVAVKGLMTSAPNVADPEENREIFKILRKISVDIKNQNMNNVDMSVLSMGMSGDYGVAIEEGATIVRVGTQIFGHRDYGTGA